MASQRPPRSAGTTVLSDKLSRAPRYPSFPPGPGESLADIGALRAGESRRVVCYLRAQSGPFPKKFRRAMLEVGGHTLTWRRIVPCRSSRMVVNVQGLSVVSARQADHRDQRFGEPRNIHLFALVQCGPPAGPFDLLVPVADVPLIRWFLAGQPDIPESELLGASVTPAPPRRVMASRRAWALAIVGCVLMLAAVTMDASAPARPAWIGFPWSLGCLLIISGITNIVRGRRRKRLDQSTGA